MAVYRWDTVLEAGRKYELKLLLRRGWSSVGNAPTFHLTAHEGLTVGAAVTELSARAEKETGLKPGTFRLEGYSIALLP